VKRKSFCTVKPEVVINLHKEMDEENISADPYHETHKCAPDTITTLSFSPSSLQSEKLNKNVTKMRKYRHSARACISPNLDMAWWETSIMLLALWM
jgi:hypothetical protein